ncbi:MAG: AraC family transcriptional regulator [Methylacidiphilales bacterium]|nr:AraC family transcriptional regulator [Candidatus Methylacidiphilales bacterium]
MARLTPVEASYISSGTRALMCGKEGKYFYGRAVYPPGGRCGPRIQPAFQLVVLIEGSLSVTVDGVTHDLAPGEAILQHPGAREFYRFSPDAKSTHTWCEASPGLFSPTDRRLLRRAHGVHQAPSSVHLLIEEGLAVPTHGSADLHDAMAALARACLLRFAAHVSSLDHRNAAAPLHLALQRALDIAATHYAELHSAEDLARRVGISASRLRALCRAVRGESPSAMIWRLKVEHAIQLIRSTGLTLGEIADDCGYANPFHLSRAVRRHTGRSPRRLRQVEWGR